MAEPVRVMVVHAQDIVREGMRALISRRPDFQLVAEACSATHAADDAEIAVPDVVVLGIQFGDASGVEACRAIHQRLPRANIIMLIPAADDEVVTASILAGASGLVLQGISGDAFLAAIESVAEGGSLLDPLVTSHVLDLLRGVVAHPAGVPSLSGQERRVIAQIAEGKTNREIGAALGLSEKTVKNYVSSILNKLKMHRRSEAAAFVARQEAHEQ